MNKIGKAGKILILCVTLILAYVVTHAILSAPAKASSTEKNCRVVHRIFTQESYKNRSFVSKRLMNWSDYREGTLYNLGLCTYVDNERWISIQNKRWNGTWIITEDFIREYVGMYSAEEFLSMYVMYVSDYLSKDSDSSYGEDTEFYNANPELLRHISNTTDSIFEMTDLFDVTSCLPASDQTISQTSETEDVRGSFNAGADNHIVWDTTKLTTDTFEYEEYTVQHIYGQKYDGGQYGWRDGKFIDIPAKFYDVDEYYLYSDRAEVGPANSLKDLDFHWITVGEKKYYQRVLKECHTYYSWESRTDITRLPSPVSILTDDYYKLSSYIQY